MLAYRRSRRPAAWTGALALAAALGLCLVLDACQSGTAPRPPVPAAPRATPPSTGSPDAAAAGAGERYRIDAQRSEVLVLVYRDGPMASLGHNHVIAVRQLSGEVILAADPAHSRWQLAFPVAALSVDEPQLRAACGADFQAPLDDVAIAGTREHMLGAALLDAMHFPLVQLQSEQIHAGDDGLRLASRIVVRDHAALVEVPVALQRSADELIASGEFDLTHSELGLTPYSVALGALRVAEQIHVRYRLVARRDADASP